MKCVNDQPNSFKGHCLALFFYAGLICRNVYTVFTRISAAALISFFAPQVRCFTPRAESLSIFRGPREGAVVGSPSSPTNSFNCCLYFFVYLF